MYLLCIINVDVDVCRLKMEEEKKELEERLSSPAALYTNEGMYVLCVSYMYDLYIILMRVCTVCIYRMYGMYICVYVCKLCGHEC